MRLQAGCLAAMFLLSLYPNIQSAPSFTDWLQAQVSSGAAFHIPTGKHYVIRTIQARDTYFVIEGDGHGVQYAEWGTVLVQASDGPMFNISYSDKNKSGFTIRDLQIQGRPGYNGSGIIIRNSKGFILDNVVIRGFSQNGLAVLDSGWHRLVNVWVMDCGWDLIRYERSNDWKWLFVSACTVKSQGYDAVSLLSCSGEIHGGHFEAGEQYGRYGLSMTGCKRTTVVEAKILFCMAAVYLQWCVNVTLIGVRAYYVSALYLEKGSRGTEVFACSLS